VLELERMGEEEQVEEGASDDEAIDSVNGTDVENV
jgi:hypothetical protein